MAPWEHNTKHCCGPATTDFMVKEDQAIGSSYYRQLCNTILSYLYVLYTENIC